MDLKGSDFDIPHGDGQRKLARMNGDNPRSNGDGRFLPSHYKYLVQFGAILRFNSTRAIE